LEDDLQDKGKIVLKGCASKLKVVIPDNIPEERMWVELAGTALDTSNLFNEIELIIDLQERQVSRNFVMKFFQDFVIPHNARISSWDTANETSRGVLASLGLNTSDPSPKRISSSVRRKKSETLVIRSSIRSGQRIEHNGDVMVIGQVNDGAEIIAEGNISVMGKLKGLVHAGYNSDENRAIVALSFEAKQVRLGTRVSTITEEADFWGKHVVVLLGKDSLLFKELRI